MQRERKAKNFLPKASYPGGPTALRAFLGKHLKYPPKAKEANVEGTVVLRLTINHKGKVTDSKIKSSLGYGCDAEAQRVVSLLVFDVDQKLRRGKVLFHKDINIHFKRPKAQPVQHQLTYKVTPTVKKPKKATSYSYSITI